MGWEDPLEEGMTTHSSILPEESPWTEEPGGLQSTGSQRVRHDWTIKYIVVMNVNYTIRWSFHNIYKCWIIMLYT